MYNHRCSGRSTRADLEHNVVSAHLFLLVRKLYRHSYGPDGPVRSVVVRKLYPTNLGPQWVPDGLASHKPYSILQTKMASKLTTMNTIQIHKKSGTYIYIYDIAYNIYAALLGLCHCDVNFTLSVMSIGATFLDIKLIKLLVVTLSCARKFLAQSMKP